MKLAQRTKTKERWYQDHIKHMMNNNLFRELWPQAQKQVYFKYDVTNYANKAITKKDKDGEKVLDFYFFVLPVYGDPRFSIEFYVPSDIETFQHFQK